MKNYLENKFRPTVRVTMPVSSFGYVFGLKKFTPACRNAFRRAGTNRPTLNETGFVTVTLT